jgi:FMN-binding protein
MKGWATILTCLILAAPAAADQVFLREPEVPTALFGADATGLRKALDLSEAELKELSRMLGRKVDARSYPYLEVWAEPKEPNKQLLGYAFFLDVIGQSLPITFAVGVKPDGTTQDIEVIIYREPYGEEIRERRFRAQFAGKKLQDPLVVGKDIDAISGATISSGSAAYAVRKGLALAQILRRRTGGNPP